MARTNATNFSGALQFPYANAATDIFKKEDVQTLALAVDQHDHTAGKGLAPPAGSITSGMIADGTIATADLANAAVTNAKLASDTARANLLTNGGFEIWQRGNGPFSTAGVTADRWNLVLSSSTMSVSKIASTIGAVGSSAQLAYTHVVYAELYQQMGAGGSQITELAGRTISLSARVKSTVASTVRLVVYDGTTTTFSSRNVGTGNEQLTLTVTLPSSYAGNIPFFGVHLDTASCTVEVNDVMLVVGSQYADYAPLHPAEDLARCLRYYEIIGDASGFPLTQTYAGAAQNFNFPFGFKAVKAATPTLTKNGTWAVTNFGQPTPAYGGLAGFSATVTAASVGNAQFYTGGVAGVNFTAESNP